jgi:ubiquitin-protein ligase
MEGFIHYALVNETITKKKSNVDVSFLLSTIIESHKKTDSLFTPEEVGSSIIKELQKIDEKNNIFFEKNIIVEDVYNIKISNFSEKHPELSLKLILDKNYYPLVPPDIMILPSIDPIFMYELINSPELNIRTTNKIRNIEYVIEYLKNKINDYNIDYKLNSEITNLMIQLLKNNNFKMKGITYDENSNKENKTKKLSGIGYGGSTGTWDVNAYLNNLTRIKHTNDNLLNDLCVFIERNRSNKDLFDIHTRFNLYQFWIDLLEKYEITEEKYYSSIKNILIIINYLNLKIKIPFLEMFIDLPDTKEITEIKTIIKLVKKEDDVVMTESKILNYVSVMKEYQFDSFPYHEKNRHAFVNEMKNLSSFNRSNTVNYIAKQYKQLSGSSALPLTDGSGIFFRQDCDALSVFKFLIIPNEDTPYKYGCFVFDVYLSPDFPNEPPKVLHATSKKNNFRFNPNLYSDGKVCLSLLGTWSGQSASEKWIPPSASNPGSTFSQLMLSIYSMIFTEFPWYNEPGRESGISNADKCPRSIEYNKELQIGTIKYAIINQLRYPEEGFENVIKTHFKLKQDEVIEYMKQQNMPETTIIQFKDLVSK